MNCKEYYEEYLRQKNKSTLKSESYSKDFKKEKETEIKTEYHKQVLQQISKPKIVRNISDCRSFFDIYSKCKENSYKNNCYRLLETYNDCLKKTK